MNRRLRIAMLAHSTNPRGGVVHAMQVAEALHDLGHDVVLHAPDATGGGFFRAPRCGAVAFSVAPARAGVFEMIEQRIADYVEHFSNPDARGFDLYHAHEGISGNALATLKQRGLIPGFVRTVHHIDDFADPRIGPLQARAIRSADGWLVVSAPWRRYLMDVFGVDAAICRNGVDRERFGSEPDGGEIGLRRRLGLGPGPAFLCVGGVEERKNTVRILEAFHQILAIRPDAELVIAGGASLLDHSRFHAEFADRLAGMGVAAKSVHRLGVVADRDMARLYRISHALVFASVKEGFGLCVLEAMASGIPVVVSSIPPFTDYLSADDAIWCDPTQPKSIADAMALSLVEDVRRVLRSRGPAVAAGHDWPKVARAHEPVYARVMEPADA